LSADAGNVNADPIQMEQVLINLGGGTHVMRLAAGRKADHQHGGA